MEPIKIFISGDFAPRLRVSEAINAGEYSSLFGDILPIMNGVDYAITNLEAPLTDVASPIRKTGPNLMAPTMSAEALKFACIDMVTLANNHAMDQGKEGLVSTLRVLKQYNIDHVGAGLNKEEQTAIKYIQLKGRTIAFINCCENEWSTSFPEGIGCNPLNEIDLFYSLQNAKANADYCVVIIHGGHEMYELPSPRMKKLYRWFIDIGADAVIGHHTHCYCGREVYGGKNIVYSLGNFVFDHPQWKNGSWTEACACILEINDSGISLQMIPFCQCNDNVGIQMLNSEELIRFKAKDKVKTNLIQDDDKLSQEFALYLKEKTNLFEVYIEPIPGKLVIALKKFHVIRSFLSSKKRLLLLNLIRCESHRDILTNHLDKTSK